MGKGKPKNWSLEALNPFGNAGDILDVRLAQAHVDGLTRNGVKTRFYRLLLIPEVLRDPIVVFQGLKREGQGEGLCYVGVPNKDYRSETIEVPPPPGMVFLVFVTQNGKIFDWRWEPRDDDNLECPENFRDRFRRFIWPTKQSL